MTSPPAAAPPATQKIQSRQAGLRQANLAILIVLAVQFALGIGVNLYVTLPAAGHPGHASWFGNGALLALHAALGMFLILAALFVLVRAIMARNAALIVTSAAGLVAILSPPSSAPASPTSSPTATPSGWRWPLRSRWPATPSACSPRPPEKPLGTQERRAYSERMKVSFTSAAVRAMSPPVAAA